jgi:DNA-binding MarR family transcriptional regulator
MVGLRGLRVLPAQPLDPGVHQVFFVSKRGELTHVAQDVLGTARGPDRLRLVERLRGAGQIASVDAMIRAVLQRVGKKAQRAGVAHEPHAASELRHLRYFVAVADAGTFTQAAEQMYIAQPTLSQQIRRLEEMIGAPLLQRCREGVRLTDAGSVMLEESRTLLCLIERGWSRTRQAAGLGRPQLRVASAPACPIASPPPPRPGWWTRQPMPAST